MPALETRSLPSRLRAVAGASPVTSAPEPAASPAPAALMSRLAESFGTMSPFGWQAQWQLYQNSTYPGPGGAPYRGATGTVADRAYGRDLPFFWSEVDLRGYRVTSRYLAETNPFAIGFTNLLVGYHVRKGYGWQACRKGAKKTPYPTSGAAEADPLVAKGQRILDEFRDANQWPLLSREAFYRWRVDGETFLRIGWSREDDIWARFVEPEQVGAPDGSTTDPWSYGIDVYEYPDGRIDPMRVLAYHVWDLESGMTGGDWVDSKYIVHAKANVVAGVKRGRPDFFPVLDLFDGVRKLYTNMLLTAVDQAAVAWMEKFPTASLSQVASHIPQQSLGNGQTVPALQSCGPQVMPGVPWYSGPGGGNRFQIPGAIYRVEGNREVVPMPTGTGTSGFMEVEKLAMRAARCRWNMPGGVSGDTDDTNFASAIVAGGPFPVAVEGSQVLWGASFERPSALRVLDRAVDAGRLTRDERAALDVEVTEPAVVTPEPDKDTTRRQQLNAAKVLSVTTWQLQEGLDPQHEAENFQAEAQRAQAAQPAPQPGAPAAADPNAPPPNAGDIFGESRVSEGAPGPAPRPGLVWNDATHRWRNPATGEEHEHPAATKPTAGKGKAAAAPKAVTVVKSADGSRTTTFAAGVPEAAAAKLAPAILDAMKELKLDIDFQDGIIPLGALAQEVKNTTPDATDGELLAALSHMRQTRQIEGQPLNEVQKLEDPKSDAYPLGGGKNLDAATLWDKGKPIHYFLLPRGKAESIFADPVHGATLRTIVDAAVSRYLEDIGPPPFAGAVFNRATHRWEKPKERGATPRPVTPPSGLPAPDSREACETIAGALRDAVAEESGGDTKDWCITTAEALRSVYPEAEVWSGGYEGMKDDQAHTIVKLGGHFIDVTADQFGGPEVHVTDELDEDKYPDFRPERTTNARPPTPPTKGSPAYRIAAAVRQALSGAPAAAESIFADPIHSDTLRAIVEAAVARVLEDMGPPPFAGAVFDKAKHRWVRPDQGTGGKSDPAAADQPAELHPDDKASIGAGIDKDVAALPEGQRPPASLVERAKEVAFGIAAKAYIWAMHATHSRAAGIIAGALGEIFDTPQDMAKLGYNPNTSSGTANPRTADAVSGALADTIGVGVSGHLVASIASKVLVKAAFWVAAKLKGKPAAEAQEDDGYAVWADFIAQLLAKTAKQMGDTGPTPDAATVEANLRELLKDRAPAE